MTTASSLAFSNMEVPGLEDTMEMASPYQGHVDDFDIDLDVMEDQASNADKDMTAADDYPDTLQDEDINQDGPRDADMMDDVAEPTMVDADDQYQEASHNVEMQYGIEESHEEEMLEDEYVDDADAAAPEYQEVQVCDNTDKPGTEEAGSAENPVAGDYAQEPAVGAHPETKPEHHDETGHDSQGALDQHNDNADQPPDTHQPEIAGGDIINSTNETDQVDSALNPLDSAKTGPDPDRPEAADDYNEGSDEHASQISQPVEEHGAAGDEGTEEQAAQDLNLQGPEQGSEHEPDTTGQVTLHPVKVYYQDNEISLFPPHEGDSSETFFLEDESLAYEPLGKLFESCREVLYEHVGENEILVLDIESLNLQLMEDSTHVSKVTLHQIIDVYLRLCHNDGIDSPEPLCLTLSTKLTISAEISDLILAASEGKGLSEINLWDDYQEVDEQLGEDSEAHDEEGEAHDQEEEAQGQEEEPVSPNRPMTNQNVDARELQAASYEAESHHDIQDNGEAYEAQELVGNDTASLAKRSSSVAPATNVQEDELNKEGEVEDANDPEFDKDTAGNEEAAHEESYDSEEQQTDTTVTMAHLPGADMNDELEDKDGSASPVHNDQTDRDLENENSEIDNSDEENPERTDPVELEVPEGPGVGDDERQDSGSLIPVVEDYRTEQPLAGHGGSSIDDAVDNVEGHSHDLEESSRAGNGDSLHKDSDSVPNLQVPERQEGDTPDPADDALGFVEDLFESPSKYSKNKDGNLDDTSEFGEDHDEFEDDTPAEILRQHDDELPLDDEEYIDLGFADGSDTVDESPVSGLKSLDNGASKRSRDPEDEFDLAENPSPDLKRSRSS
ncbi:uncharacterized protein NFIA_009450 [Aspergillus fischeri NRRL 181]|uniref:Conserved glutamic acid-rich protein n=1 Tax=Neosartorya fischeri (strain ATCC 1020 / DSM 3700 / CBS 544.65 / FGSC A1164 / JCM 1740 / NRRL 181 / WB 181) TaxID=331117 RepID=A1D1H2_NEOFI|nr:conserved glutamic acid-rich protein [Aspergillus fischeri NRRL 181]EAW22265.1 conserved glutamic acid-rich protein [Aspergillus fischeri NRRL 181]KAG2012516.1 hypothetical protein GB937_007111 [Aspergillus fischeri]